MSITDKCTGAILVPFLRLLCLEGERGTRRLVVCFNSVMESDTSHRNVMELLNDLRNLTMEVRARAPFSDKFSPFTTAYPAIDDAMTRASSIKRT